MKWPLLQHKSKSCIYGELNGKLVLRRILKDLRRKPCKSFSSWFGYQHVVFLEELERGGSKKCQIVGLARCQLSMLFLNANHTLPRDNIFKVTSRPRCSAPPPPLKLLLALEFFGDVVRCVGEKQGVY